MTCTITPRGGHSFEVSWNNVTAHYSGVNKQVRVQEGDVIIYRGPHLDTKHPNDVVAAVFGAIRLHLAGESKKQENGTFHIHT